MFAGKVISPVEILSDVFHVTAAEFYEGVLLDEQWDGQSREAREDRLARDLRFLGRLEQVDVEEDAEALRLYSAMRAKTMFMAYGLDALYRTDHTTRLAQDPNG